ncbi:MAG: hypothetical protein ACPGVT_03785 [Maricaulaceae bacterium]
MTDLIQKIDACYEALDAFVNDNKNGNRLKMSILNQKRELTNQDRSILDDVEMLLSHQASYPYAIEALRGAISLAGRKALEQTWLEA